MLHFQSNGLIRARIDVRADIARQLPPFLLVGVLVNLAMAVTKAVAAGKKIKASALATEQSGTVGPLESEHAFNQTKRNTRSNFSVQEFHFDCAAGCHQN
jgi:hypothetical protein